MPGWLARILNRTSSRPDRAWHDLPPEQALVHDLMGRIAAPQKAKSVLTQARAFLRYPLPRQQAELPALYLLLERYLTQVEPSPGTTQETLRRQVAHRFPTLLEYERFGLIFSPTAVQNTLLCRALLMTAVRRTMAVLGTAGTDQLQALGTWLEACLGTPTPDPLLGLMPPTTRDAPEWVARLYDLAAALYQHLEARFGEAAERIFEAAYQDLARAYGQLEAFPVVIGMLPRLLLDEQKIHLLNQSQQLQVRDRALSAAQDAILAAESVALESKGQLQAVLDTVGEGIITVDDQGTILLINRAAEKLWQYEKGALLGHPLTRLMTPAYPLHHFIDRPGQHATGPQPAPDVRIEVDAQRHDGTVFPIEINITETRIGDRLMFTLAAHDITDRKAYEAQLIEAKEQAEKMAQLKSTFLTNMSHEIRTPLTAILGFSYVLAEELDDNQQSLLAEIERNGKRLLETLNSVLDLARLEAGELQPILKRVDVAGTVRDIVAMLQPLALEKAITLVCDMPDGFTLPTRTDDALVNRILTNLIGNAIKFTDAGGVTVRLTTEGDTWSLAVADTGVGIEAAFLGALFDEFVQESSGLTRQYEGNGLGLAITRHLVDVLGGTITVESTKGAGSCFTVVLPYLPAEATPSPRNLTAASHGPAVDRPPVIHSPAIRPTLPTDAAPTTPGAMGTGAPGALPPAASDPG